jgi:hypothetical protein
VYVIVDVYYTIEIDKYDLKSPFGGWRVKIRRQIITLFKADMQLKDIRTKNQESRTKNKEPRTEFPL